MSIAVPREKSWQPGYQDRINAMKKPGRRLPFSWQATQHRHLPATAMRTTLCNTAGTGTLSDAAASESMRPRYVMTSLRGGVHQRANRPTSTCTALFRIPTYLQNGQRTPFSLRCARIASSGFRFRRALYVQVRQLARRNPGPLYCTERRSGSSSADIAGIRKPYPLVP